MSGWIAITRNGRLLTENNPDGTPTGIGRPVQAGIDNELKVIGTSDYGHSVAVDLDNGILALDYTSIGVQNGSVEITEARSFLWICDETNILGEYKERIATDPDKDGNYTIEYKDLIWRPIWFNRVISTMAAPVLVIGAQVTLPPDYGSKNMQKIVSLYPDGRVGIS